MVETGLQQFRRVVPNRDLRAVCHLLRMGHPLPTSIALAQLLKAAAQAHREHKEPQINEQ